MHRALMGCILGLFTLILSFPPVHAQKALTVGEFNQEVHHPYSMDDGLASNDVRSIVSLSNDIIIASTKNGISAFRRGKWENYINEPDITDLIVNEGSLYFVKQNSALYKLNKKEAPTLIYSNKEQTITAVTIQNDVFWIGLSNGLVKVRLNRESKVSELGTQQIFDLSVHNNEIAVATQNGIYLKNDSKWEAVLPGDTTQRWAPMNIRAIAHTPNGGLWFACEQGVGHRNKAGVWTLYTGDEGLPYNNFTSIATTDKDVWFGTDKGAIKFDGINWDYRQGRRWTQSDDIRDVTVDSEGNAWLATAKGVSSIALQPTTLAQKATYYEEEIDKYHRRTPYGYVTNASMEKPGDKSTAKAYVTDNDGQYTGLYTAAVSLGYGATKDPKLKADATKAFEALAFLSEVPTGGTHPAPKGFISRAIMPTDGWNPNERDNAERDRKKKEGDHLWKVLEPRWPVDESGKWYWKTDSSSDELDGHFFAYGTYYDNVAETEKEKERVREVVSRIVDHLIDHNYRLVDHDGNPTRWSDFSTEALNHHRAHWTERGLNSLSLLTYISVAHHVTGEQKYRDAYLDLAHNHSYALNGMVMPKLQFGPGSHVQFDDKMAFMNYYHLIRYETDSELLNMYYTSIYYYWNIVKQELNPFFNFVYAACCDGKIRYDQWGELDVTPTGDWLQQSIDTLKDYPLDLVDWKHTNAHRIDLVPLGDHTREPGRHLGHGHRNNGLVIPINESQSLSWSEDRWRYDTGGAGKRLRDGSPYLLAYYMGLKHGYIK